MGLGSLLEQIRIIAEQTIEAMGYVGIALLMLIENLFPPIPSEVVMPFAGFQVSQGSMTFIGIMLAGTIGALAGAVIIYYIGYAISEERLREWIRNHGKWLLMDEDDLDSALESFEEHGRIMVLAGRVIPAVRSIISLPAGIERMDLGVFLLYTTIGTIVWNAILGGAGVYLGANWEQVKTWVDRYGMVVYVVLGILIAYYIYRQVQKRRGEEDAPGEEERERERVGERG